MHTPTYRPGDPVKIRARRADANMDDHSLDAYEYLDDKVTAVGTRIVRTTRYPNGFRIADGNRNDNRRPDAKIHTLDEYNNRARVTDAILRLRTLGINIGLITYTADTLEQLLALVQAAPENQQQQQTVVAA
ncbi:beta barrel domain-containing protein [Curtobacterium citreum]